MRAVAVGLLLLPLGCKAPPAPPARVLVRVLDESKAAVANAGISTGGDLIAQTDKEGRAEVTVTGKEGAVFPLEVRCPSGYRSPNAPILIRRLQAPNVSDAAPEYLAKCSRLRHSLVIAVHAEGGPNLPILHLGKEVARSDESGKAQVIIEGEVRERVELVLSTADPKLAKVHPQNPAATFEIGDQDERKSFEVKFTRDKKAPPKVVARTGPKAF
jgi:hypothetical protein